MIVLIELHLIVTERTARVLEVFREGKCFQGRKLLE